MRSFMILLLTVTIVFAQQYNFVKDNDKYNDNIIKILIYKNDSLIGWCFWGSDNELYFMEVSSYEKSEIVNNMTLMEKLNKLKPKKAKKVTSTIGDWGGLYGFLAYRWGELTDNIDYTMVNSSDCYYCDTYFLNIPEKSPFTFLAGFGYKWDNPNINNGWYTLDFNWHRKKFKYYDAYYDYYDDEYKLSDSVDEIWWNDWSIGFGLGKDLSNGFTISGKIDYNFISADDGYDINVESDNYFTFQIDLGYSIKMGKDSYSSVKINKVFGEHFVSSSGQIMDSKQITVESDWLGLPILGGLAIGGLAALASESGYDAPSSYTPSSSSGSKGCHLYGNIKFVDYGEDYTIKFVDYGENLKIKYVSYLADSPGEWKVVEYGEDFKVKIVSYGEDYKVKEVDYGQGCN
jgi:hypothetical protein